ncbi:heavy-metal-associated domain-containing protein [Aquimarina agarivorans]|uniref:heavy-metal-associated domain-containing protein n=1 Tax=Aquimarina agarivorans TaxID=980584 RepID=UPI0002ECEC92|nr:cation transporter [Aquimarina agarivorans]
MKQVFKIEGMTCSVCATGVEQKFAELPEVLKCNVFLQQKTAELMTSTPVNVKLLQSILPDKYAVSEFLAYNPDQERTLTSVKEKTKIQQLKPLLLILGYVTVASIWIPTKQGGTINDMMLTFMGLFYIVFSFLSF